MKVLLTIVGIVVAVALGLWVVFALLVKPKARGVATTVGQATKPPPTDRTAQRVGAAADLVGALGSALSGLGIHFGGGKDAAATVTGGDPFDQAAYDAFIADWA